MNYKNVIETRPLPPLEIPRCEMILPMPRKWLEAINAYGINVETKLAHAVCGAENLPAREMEANPRFKGNWDHCYKKACVPAKPDEAKFCRAGIPIRTDILRALDVCSLQIGSTPHFLALKIIGAAIGIKQVCEEARSFTYA